MPRGYDSRSLKRRVLLFLAVYLSISFTIIASIGMYPLYLHFKQTTEDALMAAVETRGVAVQEHLIQMLQVSQQIAFKTGIRSRQENLLGGKLSTEKFDREIRPKLLNAISISGEIEGIIKFDPDLNVLLSIGDPALHNFCPATELFVLPQRFCGPFCVGDKMFVALAIPLKKSDATPLGWDVFFFAIESIQKILGKKQKGDSSVDYFIGQSLREEDNILLSPPLKATLTDISLFEKLLRETAGQNTLIHAQTESGISFVAASVTLASTSWSLVGIIEESLLYRPLQRQFGPFVFAMAFLIACGIAGMLLLFRPIGGKVFIYSDELEKLNNDMQNEVAEHLRARNNLQTALEQTEEARARINAILKSVPDPLVVLDRKGRILLMNAGAENLMNLQGGEVIGRTLSEVLDDTDLAETLVKISRECENDHPREIAWPDSPGEMKKYFLIRRAFIGEESSSTGETILLLRDITRQKEMDRLKTDFISTAAHELRTPMATMLGFSELLLEGKNFSPEQKKEFLTYILHKTEDLSHIVDDLLDISRIESGKGLTFNKEYLLIGDLLKECVIPYRKRYTAYEFELHMENPPILCVDRIKIVEVLENLLSNAVKYSHEGDTVIISGAREDGFYRVTVSDHGIGMTSEVRERIFEKFFRADTSDTAKKGVGLGMFIVKHVIEGHGGKIWVESSPGKGTNVHFTLPMDIEIG